MVVNLQSESRNKQTSLLVDLSGVCLVTILGIGKGRLARIEAGTEDLRCGTQQRGTTLQSDSVRAFFHNAYAKLGECLPDKFIRRSKSKSKHSCCSDTSDGEVASDAGDDDRDLLEWLDNADTPLHNACINASTLAKRWLPPGNLAELFDHYQTVQQLLECPAASLLGFIFLLSCTGFHVRKIYHSVIQLFFTLFHHLI